MITSDTPHCSVTQHLKLSVGHCGTCKGSVSQLFLGFSVTDDEVTWKIGEGMKVLALVLYGSWVSHCVFASLRIHLFSGYIRLQVDSLPWQLCDFAPLLYRNNHFIISVPYYLCIICPHNYALLRANHVTLCRLRSPVIVDRK